VQAQRVEQMEQDEKERIARMAKATGQDGTELPKPRVPEIREPRFGSVQYTGGLVEVLAEKDGNFIAWSSAGGPPSMMGDNNSAFALRLGAEGAAVWYRGLENDAMAIGILSELRQQGILVPDDLSVVGFDDIAVAADVAPALTTARIPMFEMGQHAVALILRPASDEARTVSTSHELIVRASTAPPRG